jgi:hypothetical protein
MHTTRLGSTKYRPVAGLGNKLTAKATPSATALKSPVPGGPTKVQPVPGQKPLNLGDKLTLKTKPLPTGTPPSAPTNPTSPAKPTGPSTTKGPGNNPSAMHAPGGRGPSSQAAVVAATSTTEGTGAAAGECRGLTADGGYLTWRRVFNAKGEPQLLCVKVFD